MKQFYFAYGLNTDLKGMAVRCPNAELIGPAKLYNYRFCFKLHANIENDVSSMVDGVLWYLTDDDLQYLDVIEGFPDYYIRKQLEVVHNNELYIAWVYVMNNSSDIESPGDFYLSRCVTGYIENGLSLAQIEKALIECENKEQLYEK